MTTKPFGYQKKSQYLSIKKRLAFLLGFFMFALVLNVAITQYVAYQIGFGFQTNPFVWMMWAITFTEYKEFFRQVWLVFLTALGSAAVITALMMAIAKKPKGNATSAGTASWAY
jgi:hypothetical protein